ncbi:MAG: hypothetical protein RL071_1670 [Pseudomonadota bacterium]|jgi:hypothetical protein
MGLLLVADGAARRLVPLPALCLVGRAPACLVQLQQPVCPAHWLEVRWGPEGWSWRPLAALERTRGSGPHRPNGWRGLEVTAERGTRVALAGDAYIELVEGGPPEPFAWDCAAAQPVTGEALERVAELLGGLMLPIAAEGDPAAALQDGALWVHRDGDRLQILRAHVPASLPETLDTRLDLGRGAVSVEVDLGASVADLVQGSARVQVSGQAVRTFALYARARAADPAGEGWLSANDAWAAWLELGGAAEATVEAVSWERTRLRQLLHRARVGSVEAVFARRKVGAFIQIRLGDVISEVIERG